MVYQLTPDPDKPCLIARVLWNVAEEGHADIQIREVDDAAVLRVPARDLAN
jgi:hypothetical protein